METRPTILLFSAFYEPWVSGAERFVTETVAHLDGRYRFVVVTSRLSRSVQRREERGDRVIVRVGLGMRADKYLYPLLAPLAALRERPAVAHAVMESYAGVALWLHAILRPRVPRILTLQSGDLDSAEKQRRIPGWLWTRIHRAPDHVTAISRFLGRRAARLRGGDAEVSVIPNGVDLSAVPAAHDRVPCRIVCVARLAWEKGLPYLLEALAEARKAVPDAHLVLVGDGPERAALEERARALGVADAVAFRGRLGNREALEEVARASVFACPSLAEGLGIVFLEAQAVGVPAVGTDVGGIPDVIEDGATGLLVPPRESAPLARALVRMLTDRAFADACIARARERLPRFAWQGIMAEIAALYERLRTERRVLIATGIWPPAIGGPATYVRTIAPRLAAAGWLVRILTYGDARAVPPPRGVSLSVVPTGLPPLLRHAVYAWRAFRLGRSADLLFLQDPFSAGAPAAVANLFLKRKILLKVVGDYAWEQGQNRFSVTDLLDAFQDRRYGLAVEAFRAVERAVARRADAILTPSAYLAGVVTRWGIPRERVRVVPNAVSLPAAAVAHPPSVSRPPVITTAGRLLPWKGVRELVAALPSVRQTVPDATLAIVGDGPLRQAIEEDARRLGLVGAVDFRGRLPQAEAHAAVAMSRVFVLYSGYEGFSHQLVEVMALGVPVVCSSAGGNAEVAKDGENALVVRFGDGPALVAAIVRLLKDADLSARIATRARETAAAYTVDRMVAGLADVLDVLCPSRSS